MSVANTQYSTNSYRIDVNNELGSNNIIAEVNTAITTLGWSLYDSVTQTTYSPMATYVYRVLNADSTTYKYAILRWNTLLLNFNLSACEAWDQVNHIATNETWHNSGCFYQGYDIKDCSIFVGATTRHLVIQPFIRNEPGLWTAILEFERVAGEDISQNTVPCFGYTNSLMLGTPWGQTSNSNTSTYMFAMPRTADNQTGAYAAKIMAPVTTRGMYPPYYPSANTGNTGANSVVIVQTHDGNNLHLGSYYNTIGSWGWDPTKTVVSPISVDHIYKSMPFGRIYNAAITKPVGSNSWDTTYINADATGGWPSGTGSNTEMLCLALNGGCEDTTGFNNTTGRIVQTWSNNSNIIYGSCLAIGNNVWAAANNGVWTWDMGAGANTTAIQRYINTNGVIDIMFDGLRSVYGTTNNGIVQIDTETYAANVNTAADLGCMYINMDQRFIYATSRTKNVQPKIYVFHRANNNLNAHLNAGPTLTGSTVFSTPVPDYKGFVYSVNLPGSTSSVTIRQIVWASDAANANVGLANINNPIYTGTTNYQNFQGRFWYEYNSDRLYMIGNYSGTGYIWEYANVANIAIGGVAIGAWANANVYQSTNFSWSGGGIVGNGGYAPSIAANNAWGFYGDLVITPRRGYLHFTPRRVGANQTSQTAFSTSVSMEHPDAPGGTGKPRNMFAYTGSDVIGIVHGWPTHQWTNGVRIFQTLWRANTEARIIALSNLYGNTNINQYQTGRFLIKA